MSKRNPPVVLGAGAMAILVLLGAVGMRLDTPSTGRIAVGIPITEVATSMIPLRPFDYPAHLGDEVAAKPPGYPEGSCRVTPDPSPDAVAASDCVNNTLPGGPTFARYEQFADLATVLNAFQADARSTALQPCPGSTDSAPGTWTLKSDPSVNGSIMCYTSPDNVAHVEWTNNTDLLRANASGPDLASLYGWLQGLIATL